MIISKFLGMRTVGDSKDIDPTYCVEQQDMINVSMDTISTRAGTTKYNSTAFAGKVLGLFYYKRKNGQTATLSANDNGEIFSGAS